MMENDKKFDLYNAQQEMKQKRPLLLTRRDQERKIKVAFLRLQVETAAQLNKVFKILNFIVYHVVVL